MKCPVVSFEVSVGLVSVLSHLADGKPELGRAVVTSFSGQRGREGVLTALLCFSACSESSTMNRGH